MKVCEGAPWCLMLVPDGTRACKMHQRYPALFNEGRDKWASRVRKGEAALKRAAVKQAESDAAMKRKR